MISWLEKIKTKVTSHEKPELPAIPGEERVLVWNNHKIVYSVLGDGKPLLLLHGANASAWRFEMRRNIEPLAAGGYRVFAPDMPGFGKSSRLPQPYTAHQYINFLKDFASEIKTQEGQAVTVVASTLVAAHAIAAAAQAPELFGPMLLICPTGIKHLARHQPSDKQRQAFHWLTKPAGRVLFWLLTSRPSTRLFLRRDAYYDKKYVTPGIIEGYHRAARYPNAEYAPFSFITEYLSYNVSQEWPNLQQPTAICWGDKSETLPLKDLDDFLRLRPNTVHKVFANTRMAPHDERAEEFNSWALDTLTKLSETTLQTDQDKDKQITAA